MVEVGGRGQGRWVGGGGGGIYILNLELVLMNQPHTVRT